MYKKIFLLDNFDSFTFNLVDYFKQLGCEVEVYRNTVDIEKVSVVDPDLIVFSPGPSVPANAGNMMAIIEKYHKRYPMFGVCLGHEAFIEYFGGSLKFVPPVHGKSSSIKHDGRSIFRGLPVGFKAGRYHSLCADEVPSCFEISSTYDDLVMSVRHKELPIEGVQFHPESVLSMKGGHGFKMIKNVVENGLGCNEVERFLNNSIEGLLGVDEQVKFLERYTPEKVSASDLQVFANFMMGKMSASLNLPGAIDICGTGGSGLERINTSTISSFILAALGVGVAKHGNKAASGRFGSFDLLEALGVDIERSDLEDAYEKSGLAFIYARNFHPVMKHFVEARKSIGKPTIFNILGPLLNPAGVKRQIIGTAFKDQMKLIAEACLLLGKERVMVVRGEDGLDEVSLSGKTDVVELRDGEIFEYSLDVSDFGLSECAFEEIAGGGAAFNTDIALSILEGRCDSRHADLVYINCALALRLAGVCEDLKVGVELARDANGIDVLKNYNGNILRDIALNKVLSKSERSFKNALVGDGSVRVIAEIKFASPSEGKIREGNVVEEIAKAYEEAGAAAISVLTDSQFFGGSFENLRRASEASELPILCKEFIVDEYQIKMARNFGADAVLLIAKLLDTEKLKKFIAVASELGMDSLVEVHDEKELESALAAGAEIIGINNRNLENFKIDLGTTNRLAEKIPDSKVVVSESGINSKSDIEKLGKKVNAVLVGTLLMKSDDINSTLHAIV